MENTVKRAHINTGVIRIMFNDDENNIIEFNPMDGNFTERFYNLLKDFESKLGEYEQRSKELDASFTELDRFGFPVHLDKGVAFIKEVCIYLRGQIDHVFGEGTSQKAFGDCLSLESIQQFFTEITPYMQEARSEVMAKYKNSGSKRVMR